MAIEQILNTAPQFQAASIQNSFIDVSSMPVKLALVSGTLQLIDDFNDGIRDPLWSTAAGSAQTLVSFEPVGVNDWQEFLNRLGEGKDLLAQTFIPTQDFQLLTITMYLHNQSLQPTDGITVQIRTTDGLGNPTSTILASKFVATNDWPAPTVTLGLFDFSLVDFSLAVPLPLTAGQKYAIVLEPNWTPSSSSYASALGSFNDYPDGIALKFNGSIWSQVFDGSINFLNDFHFRITGVLPGAEPVETGGFLQFDYPAASGQKFIAVARNQALTDIELETRFIWEILASPANSSSEFGLHFLKGQIGIHTIDKDDFLVWELIFSPTPTNGIFRVIPIMTDSSGVKRTFVSGGGGWVPYDFQFGYLVGSPGNNVPVTFRVTRDQSTQGIRMLAYRNDDPQDVIFDTDVSPAPRTLPGDYFFNIGLGINVNGSRFKFDYFKVPTTAEESPQGELTLRHSFGTRSQLTQFTIDRILPVAGDVINVRVRAADTIAQLDALPFGSIIPTTVQGNVETGTVSAPFGFFLDTKLEFIRASPGPLLNSLTLTLEEEVPPPPPPPPEQQAVSEDSPIIFSLDEVGPGLTRITDSESGPNETANTISVKDGDPETRWISQNAQDGQEVTLTISFIDSQGNPDSRKISAVYIRNTNVKQFRIHVGANDLVSGDLAGADLLVAFDEIESDSIQISSSSTQTANENKKIGEIYAGNILLTLPGFSSYEPGRTKFQSGQFRAIGGRLVRFNGVSKYSSRWTVTFLSPTDKDQLEKIFRENEFVTFLPEPKFRPRGLFDVGWRMEELFFPYSELFKVPGHTVEVQMEEI